MKHIGILLGGGFIIWLAFALISALLLAIDNIIFLNFT